MPTARTPVTIRFVERDGRSGWEAIRLGVVPETIVIGLRPTAEECIRVVRAFNPTEVVEVVR